MSTDYDSVRLNAVQALDAGDAKAAFQTFRSVLEYPGPAPDRWVDAFGVFERIARALADTELSATVQEAVRAPEDAQAIYTLGYQLIEAGLPGVAATALARANRLAPGQEAVVCELVAALEGAMLPAEACAVLRAAPDVLESSFIGRYLLAFNALMTGDLSTPERLLDGLADGGDPERAHLRSTIQGMLERAAALAECSPLDSEDLRGWHFVLNGGVLLHLSPHGPEVMRGRYAFFQDSEELCREAILRLSAVLETWGVIPARVFAPADRDSRALAHATGAVLGIPVEDWPEAGTDAPGLIVAYDLGSVPHESLASLAAHRPGQVLWSHASCWTAETAFAPDVVTFLYQMNTSPWGERLRVGEDGKAARTRPEEAAPQELGERVARTQLDPADLSDLDALRSVAASAVTPSAHHVAGGLRESGRRRKQWLGSPVRSSRFL